MRKENNHGSLMINLEVAGEPIAQMRAKPNYRNRCMYDPQKAEKEKIRWQLRSDYKEELLTGPLQAYILYYFPIPKSASKKMRKSMITGEVHHVMKPDKDNLEKFICDCMTGVIYDDDCKIVDNRGIKLFSEYPRTVIRIVRLTFNPKLQEELNKLYEIDTRDSGNGTFPRNHPHGERIEANFNVPSGDK